MAEGKNYQIMDLVATGGTAVLYRAVQTSLDRVVAVKKLHYHLTTDENFTRRFILEAKAAASLDHENIVKIIDFGVEDGTYMMVMEFIEGESLKDILERWKQLPPSFALAVVHQICMGLEHAHAKGIVHRDIKPGNVMLARTGKAKITDFGLAKLAQGQTQHTAANSILGTPLYMSPEQAFGESVDQRSDLFSLGTVLYEVLTGHQPFHNESYMGVIQNIIHHNAPHPSRLGVELPAGVEAIVLKAMHKNRDARFQSAREFRQMIEKHMGLDALKEATENLKTLLVTDGATVVLPKTERVRDKRRRLRRSMAVAIVVASAAGFAAVGYPLLPDAVRARIAGAVSHLGGEAPAPVATEQREFFAAGSTDGFPDANPLDSTTTHPVALAFGFARRDTVTSSHGKAAPDEPGTQLEDSNAVATAPSGDLRETQQSLQRTVPERKEPSPNTPNAAEAAKIGWLSVTSEPTAEMFVDGVYMGDTPRVRLELPGGRHTLECRTPKYETYVESASITPGELSSRSIVMKKLVGRISLSTIEGAEVYLDGVLIGLTPLQGPFELEAGQHQLTVKKAGYHVWNNSVAVDARQLLPLKITLSPIY